MCPVPVYRQDDGTGDLARQRWVGRLLGWCRAWRRWQATGSWPREDGGGPAWGASGEFERGGLRWRPHWDLQGFRGPWCLRCGMGPYGRRPARLHGTPCMGEGTLKASHMLELRSGRHDAALRLAPASWRDRAQAAGWTGAA